MVILDNYMAVSANTTDSSATYTPANGEKVHINMLSGDAAMSNDVKVCVVWDTTCIFSTHNSNTQIAPPGETLYEITGDGSKVLKIDLVNNTDQTETIGARVMGEIYG